MLSENSEIILKIGSGLFWTLTYLIIIRRGFVDKTYGMPMAALAANISWECIFSFVHPHEPPQLYINIIWFLFDLIIVFQFLKYGKERLKDLISPKWFYPFSLISLIVGGALVYTISYEFSDWDGKYAAFGQNLMMSVCFVMLLASRKTMEGQSIYVGLFKLIGTALPSFLFFTKYPDSVLLNTIYLSILMFDFIYVAMIWNYEKKCGNNPWKRW